ncbi:YrvL family regulatory protein [Cytobacillus gottheilii]|uniref:YrvL family regulatory protein n=1 Tax=Cytobacillus gottheilii TaxID=859144 RepID=UPI00082BB1FD|nr:YrvL family regulatory protein [Cytobacillus gottheilii]
MSEPNRPFKEESKSTKFFIIVTMSLLLLGAVGFVVAGYYFGILGLFNILGIHYESLFSLFLFVLFYFLLGIIGDIVLKAFNILMKAAGITGKFSFSAGILLFSVLINWAIISVINLLMDSIEIAAVTGMVLALIISIIEMALDSPDN